MAGRGVLGAAPAGPAPPARRVPGLFQKRARYPRFKSRHGKQAATYTRSAFRWRDGQLTLAKTSAPLRFAWSWPDLDPAALDPSTVTVSRDPAGRWFAVLHVDVPEAVRFPPLARRSAWISA
jgi:putative transposase